MINSFSLYSLVRKFSSLLPRLASIGSLTSLATVVKATAGLSPGATALPALYATTDTQDGCNPLLDTP